MNTIDFYNDVINKIKKDVNASKEYDIKVLQDLFARITISNSEEIKKEINEFPKKFDRKCITMPKKPDTLPYGDYKEICNTAYKDMITEVSRQYNFEIVGMIDELLMKIPNKVIDFRKNKEQDTNNKGSVCSKCFPEQLNLF